MKWQALPVWTTGFVLNRSTSGFAFARTNRIGKIVDARSDVTRYTGVQQTGRPEPEKGFGRCPVGLAGRAGRRRVQDSVGGRPSVDPASSKRFHKAYRFPADEVTEKVVAKGCVSSGRRTPGRVIEKSE